MFSSCRKRVILTSLRSLGHHTSLLVTTFYKYIQVSKSFVLDSCWALSRTPLCINLCSERHWLSLLHNYTFSGVTLHCVDSLTSLNIALPIFGLELRNQFSLFMSDAFRVFQLQNLVQLEVFNTQHLNIDVLPHTLRQLKLSNICSVSTSPHIDSRIAYLELTNVHHWAIDNLLMCLKQLSLNNCTLLHFPTTLTVLSVSFCNFTNINLSSCTSLYKLTLKFCPEVNTIQLPPHINNLIIVGCSELAIVNYFTSLPLLSLEVDDCPFLSTSQLHCSFPYVKKLCLYNINYTLRLHCPNVMKLSLHNCSVFQPFDSVQYLYVNRLTNLLVHDLTHKSFSKVKELVIESIEEALDEGTEKLQFHFPELQALVGTNDVLNYFHFDPDHHDFLIKCT
ncbi:hypothetical protein P9112_013880 [Eukaryota sp. TZLM1-RC]